MAFISPDLVMPDPIQQCVDMVYREQVPSTRFTEPGRSREFQRGLVARSGGSGLDLPLQLSLGHPYQPSLSPRLLFSLSMSGFFPHKRLYL